MFRNLFIFFLNFFFKSDTIEEMKRLTLLLIGLALADLLAAIDNTAVSIAIPKIANFFNLDPSGISWMQTLYILALLVLLIPSGKFGDHYGHKRNFFIGLILFGFGSLGIMIVNNFNILLLFRIIQGAGAAILYTASGALIAHHWKKTEFAFGITAAFFSIGLLIGPVLGGILTDLTIKQFPGWHLIFAINIPIVFFSAYLVSKNSNETPTQKQKLSIDWIGTFLLTLLLGSVVLRLVQSMWPLQLTILIFLSLILLIINEKLSKHPLLRFDFFTNQTFSAISIFTLVIMFTIMGLSYLNTFFLQDVLGKSATQSGIMMIPIFLGMGVFAVISGFYQNWKISTIISSILVIISLIILSRVSSSTPYFKGLFWGYLLASAGGGIMMTNTFAAALGSVKKVYSGIASGYINTAQQVGTLGGISFVAGQDILNSFQGIYKALVFIAFIALISSLFVKNNRLEER